jgi:hypothetical protein
VALRGSGERLLRRADRLRLGYFCKVEFVTVALLALMPKAVPRLVTLPSFN